MAAPYSLPDGYFYLDAAAAQRYADNKGREMVLSQTVGANVGATLDAWVQRMWLAGSQEVAPGTGRGYVGQTRLIPMLGVQEQIVSAGLPSETDASGAVASVLYKISDFGSIALEDHIALVRFIPVDAGTELVWTIKQTPSTQAAEPKPDTPDVNAIIVKFLRQGLADLARSFEA